MVKKLLSGLGITVLGATLLFALTGCAGEDETTTTTQETKTETTATQDTTATSESGDTIKVGAVFPLTGDGAAYGEPMQKVTMIALEKVNADNGVNGKKIEMIFEDGKCNGADAANAANKLINVDKVKVIYGGLCSSETLAIAPLAEKAKVIVLSPGSSSPDVSKAGDFIFRNYPSDASQGKILAEEAGKKGYKKVAILSEQNDYTVGIQKVFEEKFKELGGTVDVQTYLPNDSDFRTPLVKLKSGSPDALFINPQTPAKADLAFKQLEELKWSVPLMANDATAGYQDLIKKYATLIEGMLTAEFSYDKENPDFIALSDKYKEMTDTDMPYGTYATTYYDGVYILKDMLAASGDDTEKMKEFLYAIKDRKGLSGTLTLDENGDPMSGHALEIVKDGKVIPYTE